MATAVFHFGVFRWVCCIFRKQQLACPQTPFSFSKSSFLWPSVKRALKPKNQAEFTLCAKGNRPCALRGIALARHGGPAAVAPHSELHSSELKTRSNFGGNFRLRNLNRNSWWVFQLQNQLVFGTHFSAPKTLQLALWLQNWALGSIFLSSKIRKFSACFFACRKEHTFQQQKAAEAGCKMALAGRKK